MCYFFQKKDYHLNERLLFSELRACFEKIGGVQIQNQKKAINQYQPKSKLNLPLDGASKLLTYNYGKFVLNILKIKS